MGLVPGGGLLNLSLSTVDRRGSIPPGPTTLNGEKMGLFPGWRSKLNRRFGGGVMSRMHTKHIIYMVGKRDPYPLVIIPKFERWLHDMGL